MNGMFFAGWAVLLEFEAVGIVSLVLEAVVIAVFAFRTLERNFESRGFNGHCEKTPYKKITPLFGAYKKYSKKGRACQPIFAVNLGNFIKRLNVISSGTK